MEYWPNAPEYEAAYLHKICVCRRFAGLGMTNGRSMALYEMEIYKGNSD